MKKMLGIVAGALLLAGLAAPSAYAMTYYPGPYPYQYPYQQYPYQPNYYIPSQPCYMNPYGYNSGYNTLYLYYRSSNCYYQTPQYPMYPYYQNYNQNYYYQQNMYPSYPNYYYQY